ncbi:unnamed protein product, partial [marine sediment metagenome]
MVIIILVDKNFLKLIFPPFKWERDVEMVLEANPDYYGTPPAYKNVVVKYFADSTTMRLALENKEIDIAWK